MRGSSAVPALPGATWISATRGEGDGRFFPDQSAIDLAKLDLDRQFLVKERADTGLRKKHSRAWFDTMVADYLLDAGQRNSYNFV